MVARQPRERVLVTNKRLAEGAVHSSLEHERYRSWVVSERSERYLLVSQSRIVIYQPRLYHHDIVINGIPSRVVCLRLTVMASESGLNTTASVDIHVSPLALCSSILTKREPDVTSLGNAIESPHASVRIVCSGADSVHIVELALSASLGRTQDDPITRLSAAMKLGHDVTDDTDRSGSLGVSRSGASERPNIVMVSIDSLRADH